MFNTLFALFKEGEGLVSMYNITSNLHSILNQFTEDELKDISTKNAAIDCLIQILEAHKDK